MPLILVDRAQKVLPVSLQAFNRPLSHVEEGVTCIATISEVKVFAFAFTSWNFFEVDIVDGRPRLVIKLYCSNIGWDTIMILTIRARYHACGHRKAIKVREPIRIFILFFEKTRLHLIVLVAK